MSDSEDSDILADIKALDEALSLKTQNATQRANSSLRSNSLSSIRSTDSESSDDECFDYLSTVQCTDTNTLNAYEINIKLTVGLKLVQKKLLNLLDKCEKKIKQLDDKIANGSAGTNVDCSLYSKLAMTNAGMPYFKDKDLFYCPKNYDTKQKESRGELSVLSLSKPSRWSAKDKETLLKAIQNEASEAILANKFNQDTGKIRKKTSDDQPNESTFVLPMNFKQMVGPLGEREFDWYKISVMHFENKHSPVECRAMWNVYLHPDIRKSGWTNRENNLLLQCARNNNYQDWDTIAKNLNSNRSAYQCFVRYNTIKKVPTGSFWSKTEDRHLSHIIDTLKTGDYIPWSEVAFYLPHRTKQQIYTRWIYRKLPHLKKGRFTYSETDTLLKAVKIYGTDFAKISNKVMPNRCSSQLIDHYNRVMERLVGNNTWTFDDDVKLIHLRQTLGNTWVKIAEYFPGKSRTQVRHRYSSLLRYTRRDISLENIPRARGKTKTTRKTSKDTPSSVKQNVFGVGFESDFGDINDIHLRLYENLSFPPSKEPFTVQEECYDFEKLVRDTKRSYNVLHMLDARLYLPGGDFLDYVHLNKRDKQLFISLIEYINSAGDNHKQKNALVEQCRTRMFGSVSKVSEESHFIPPLPFNGHMRIGKSKKSSITDTIDCDLNCEEKYLIDVPEYFFVSSHTLPVVSWEEEIEFDRLSEYLIKQTFNGTLNEKTTNLLRSLPCTLFFAKKERETADDLEITNKRKNLQYLYDSRNFDYFDEAEEANMFNNLVLPNQATLLGCKNLLLWKLLYEYQNHDVVASLENEELETESVDYQLLRMRLVRLFKIPVGLSNIKLRITDLDLNVFHEQKYASIQEDPNITKKRKSLENENLSICLHKKRKCNNVFNDEVA
ncbi:snRNA-activating protein complex subunit 4 isoform X2 [Pseudomyrmex gracilis]|nr:snRNA-activating protein complex subunit 4 isoform X2 [Pseudomyrmex gracilis]